MLGKLSLNGIKRVLDHLEGKGIRVRGN